MVPSHVHPFAKSGRWLILSDAMIPSVTPLLRLLLRARSFFPGFVVIFAVSIPGGVQASDFQGATHMVPFEEETINYNNAAVTGAVAQLQKRLESGAVNFKYDDNYGYLLALLDELKIPKSSQMLVFSKTSLQRELISPERPRAIFFNDSIYVGFIPGAPLLELSIADPKLGGVFYTLDQTKAKRPELVRNNQCLECHASSKTMGVPGHVVRSFATDENGVVDLSSGTSQVTHRTPFEERWGGWYVTGTHGAQTHRGNLVGKAAFERHVKEPNFAGNATNLTDRFDISPYVSGQSDIVALMVLEHQTHMHNFIARLNQEATIQLKQYGHVRYLKNVTESFVKYLLFAEEAPLTSEVKGAPEFVRDFEGLGPKDARGRSLREFELKTRLFKYPCSYLIYSEAFEALPKEIKEKVYLRLWEILSGKETSAEYARLTPATRRSVAEILAGTKSDLPPEWKNAFAVTAQGRR
jgi:hypothetical protein